MKAISTTLFFALLFLACNSKPKVIEATDSVEELEQPIADETSSQLHKVMVEEVLHTSRYTYLQVTEEGGEAFWIAIPRKEVEKGGPYYYRGGLKKTNFKSVEHDRVFETVYLVSDVSKDPGMNGMGTANPHDHIEAATAPDQNAKIDPPPGGITIAELFKNRDKYNGQTVRIRGRCVKLNNMIMNRNWVHLQDDSVKDGEMNLTVTTTENIPIGAIVAMEGKITLNKDFGAGYKYEIIMEEAQLLQ